MPPHPITLKLGQASLINTEKYHQKEAIIAALGEYYNLDLSTPITPAPQILSEQALGEGNSAKAYLAVAPDGNIACLKIINPKFSDLESFYSAVQSMIVEYLVFTNYPHQNFPITYALGRIGDDLAMLMELGRNWHTEDFPLSPQQLIHTITDYADGLEHLHSLNLVHGDPKPANILDTGNRIVIIDLSAASGVINFNGQTYELIQREATPGYYPHEAGHHSTPLTDIYGLAITIYQMATGNSPDSVVGDLQTGILKFIESGLEIMSLPPDPHIPEPALMVLNRALDYFNPYYQTPKQLVDDFIYQYLKETFEI